MSNSALLESIAPQLAAARLARYDTEYKVEYRHRPAPSVVNEPFDYGHAN